MLEFAVEGRKEYIAEFTLGAQTVTGDDSGEVVKTMPVPAFGKQELEAVLAQFTGKQMQLPPMYSAIKINGKKLYQLARQGVEVERTARPIEVYKLELLHYTANSFTVRVACSKGTYIFAPGVRVMRYPRSWRRFGNGAGNLRYDELFAAHAGGSLHD